MYFKRRMLLYPSHCAHPCCWPCRATPQLLPCDEVKEIVWEMMLRGFMGSTEGSFLPSLTLSDVLTNKDDNTSPLGILHKTAGKMT